MCGSLRLKSLQWSNETFSSYVAVALLQVLGRLTGYLCRSRTFCGAALVTFFVAAFMPCGQRGVAASEVVWPTELKVFSRWGEVCCLPSKRLPRRAKVFLHGPGCKKGIKKCFFHLLYGSMVWVRDCPVCPGGHEGVHVGAPVSVRVDLETHLWLVVSCVLSRRRIRHLSLLTREPITADLLVLGLSSC